MPTEKEMINNLIDAYTSLQRIKSAQDTQKELEYQGFKSKTRIIWYYYN